MLRYTGDGVKSGVELSTAVSILRVDEAVGLSDAIFCNRFSFLITGYNISLEKMEGWKQLYK